MKKSAPGKPPSSRLTKTRDNRGSDRTSHHNDARPNRQSKQRLSDQAQVPDNNVDRPAVVAKSTTAVNKLLLARIRLQREVLKPIYGLFPPPSLRESVNTDESSSKQAALEAIDDALAVVRRIQEALSSSSTSCRDESSGVISDRSMRENYRRNIVIPILDEVKSELAVHDVALLSTFDQPIGRQYDGFIKGSFSTHEPSKRSRSAASGGTVGEGRPWVPSFSEGELLMAELRGLSKEDMIPLIYTGENCYEMVLRKFRKNGSVSRGGLSGGDVFTDSLLHESESKKNRKERADRSLSRVKFDVIPELVDFMPRMNPPPVHEIEQITAVLS